MPLQDDQTWQQLATQGCGFVTIVSGTFLLHTTKDLDLTAVNLEHILDRHDDASVASSAALSAGSVRERRPAAAAGQGLEMGGMEVVKADAAEKGLSNGAAQDEEEHHPLIGSGGGQVNSSSAAARGTRKQRGLATLL